MGLSESGPVITVIAQLLNSVTHLFSSSIYRREKEGFPMCVRGLTNQKCSHIEGAEAARSSPEPNPQSTVRPSLGNFATLIPRKGTSRATLSN